MSNFKKIIENDSEPELPIIILQFLVTEKFLYHLYKFQYINKNGFQLFLGLPKLILKNDIFRYQLSSNIKCFKINK